MNEISNEVDPEQFVGEPPAVGEPGELVMLGAVAKLLLGAAALGDVDQHPPELDATAVDRAAHGTLVAHPEHPPVGGEDPVLDRERLERLRAALLRGLQPLAIAFRHAHLNHDGVTRRKVGNVLLQLLLFYLVYYPGHTCILCHSRSVAVARNHTILRILRI